MSTLGYGIRQGIKSIFQNKLFSLAAIGTITACLFLIGVFYALFANFRHMVYNAESTVGLIVFFDEDVTSAQIQSIGNKIEHQPQVDHVNYVSGEEAWKRFKEDLLEGQQELIAAFGTENPLQHSDSYEVYLKDVSKQEELVEYIKGLYGVRKVNGSASVAIGFGSFNLLIGYISIGFILMMVLISIFLIYSAVAMGINVRKDEIAIMKLIGATDLFVRLPFIIEGIVMGLVGAAIPLGLLRLTYGRVILFIITHFSNLSSWLTFLMPGEIFIVLIPLSIGIGVGIGVLGSVMSMRKHLHV